MFHCFFYWLNCAQKNLYLILKPNLSFFPVQWIIKKLFIVFVFITTLNTNQSSVFATSNNSFDDYGIIFSCTIDLMKANILPQIFNLDV